MKSVNVSLVDARGGVLAQDIIAKSDVPPFDRSTVDGYAVKAKNTFGADETTPVSLKLCGHISIGKLPNIVVEDGTAAEIVTGAPIPPGADAVVMLEYTLRKDQVVQVFRPVSKRENMMNAGSDIPKGETILKEGQTLSPRQIGALAALGLTTVKVYSPPKVALISTGTEIVKPGTPLPPGKIYDINSHTLSAAVLEAGGQPCTFGIVKDDYEQLKAALKNALDTTDVVITSGGVSVGPKDIVPHVLNELGEPGVLVCGIAVKPGKPTTIAVIDEKPVFSLPGNPTSSLLMFYLFVRPILLSMSGKNSGPPQTVKAVAALKMFSARGRRTFVMVNLTRDNVSGLIASPIPLGLSGAITTLTKADGFVEIQEDKQFINAGNAVTVHLF